MRMRTAGAVMAVTLWAAALDALGADAGRDWLDVVLDLRVSRSVDGGQGPSTPEDVVSALRGGGAAIDCATLTFRTMERGANEASCEGRWTIEGASVLVTLTFMKARGVALLSSMSFSALEGGEAWRRLVEKRLEERLGPAATRATAKTWRTGERLLAVHDPSLAPCGGLCVPYLWVSTASHPQAERRGLTR
jgi:hypothetical protein